MRSSAVGPSNGPTRLCLVWNREGEVRKPQTLKPNPSTRVRALEKLLVKFLSAAERAQEGSGFRV